jgi:acyl-CoA synthetase (AMP-forming)/AMP-acid ligase II
MHSKSVEIFAMTTPTLQSILSLPHQSVTFLTPGRTLDRDALDEETRRVAAALMARGLRRGDRILCIVRSSMDAVAVLLGALRAGLVVVPANASYEAKELSHVLADSGAALVVVEQPTPVVSGVAHHVPVLTYAQVIEEGNHAVFIAAPMPSLDAAADDDVALLIYTSGTTGRAKGCVHTWRGLRAGVGALAEHWRMSPSDVVVHALPLFHVHGLCVALLTALWAGASTILLPRFSPEAVVEAVARGGTVFMSVPTMVHRLLAHLDEHPGDAAVLGRLRLWTCGSAALLASQLEAVRNKTGLTILERYGMSETLITLSNSLDGERRPGAVGWPLPGVRMRVVDDELLVHTPAICRGYWNQSEASHESFIDDEGDGLRWFRTGDVVSVAPDGCVRIVGRASQDFLKVGGYKISAREIEEELAQNDDVHSVAVVGVPDEEWGERICAVVVAKEGRTPTLASLQETTRLHEAKKPRALVLVDALPRNAMGKVLKHELKVLVAEQLGATSSPESRTRQERV